MVSFKRAVSQAMFSILLLNMATSVIAEVRGANGTGTRLSYADECKAEERNAAKAAKVVSNTLWWSIPTAFVAGLVVRYAIEKKYTSCPEQYKFLGTVGLTALTGVGMREVLRAQNIDHSLPIFAVATIVSGVAGSFAGQTLAGK